MDYLHVQADNPWYNYYTIQEIIIGFNHSNTKLGYILYIRTSKFVAYNTAFALHKPLQFSKQANILSMIAFFFIQNHAQYCGFQFKCMYVRILSGIKVWLQALYCCFCFLICIFSSEIVLEYDLDYG